MGDMYNSCSPSSMGGSDHLSSDDLSLFLDQILLRSSSSSSSLPTTSSCSSFVAHKGPRAQSFAAPLSIPRESHPHSSSTLLKEGTSGSDSGDGVNVGYFSGNVRGGARNSASLSIGGVSENETDEGDYGSEEGLEALIEEVPAKPTPSRSSSKRSRASEVHNLSEKRRRSRINEKMKALQNLIPNSNKTDKASMLDEAIEYLKQLQLQVQMLSMRNGISLSPMCLPGLLQPIHLSQFSRGFSEENVSQHMNVMGSLPLSQESSEQINYDLVNQCSVSNQQSLCNMSTVINSETSYGTESSIRAHFGPFPLHATSGEIGRKDGLPHQQLNADHSERIPSEFEMAKARASFPLETQAYNLKDGNTLEASVLGRDESERVFLKNIEHNLILSPSFQGTQAGRSTFSDEIKIERQDI